MTEIEFVLALNELGYKIDDIKLNQLKKYYELLCEWNEKVNLTSIIEKNQVYLKHFYDSATMIKVINLREYETFCDVGTGAGFPGIVLKILFPNLNVTLIDSLNKRIDFLNIVIKELGLERVEVIHTRSEEYAINNKEKFEVVTARAVAPLNILLECCIPLVKKDYFFIPLKANISREIIDSEKAFKMLGCEILEVKEFLLPIENSTRSIIKIIKKNHTNPKFPRKYSEIKKRPL